MANCLGKVAVSIKEDAFGTQQLENTKYTPLVIRNRDESGKNRDGNYLFHDYRLKDLSLYPADAQFFN